MKRNILSLCLLFALETKALVLNGQQTTPAEIAAIAKNETVEVSPEALSRAEAGFKVLLDAAKTGLPIYGFTVGVGWNKDRQFVNVNGELDEALIQASKDFNRGLIHAHVGAVGEALPAETVRAIMASRLNMVLSGYTGMQPEFIQTYVDMLNKNVIPVIPSKGSIGQADITVLGHLALNMIGEGEVFYQDKRMPAEEAFKLAGIKKVEPYAKDALALLSTNAASLGQAVLAQQDLQQLLKMQTLVYALSLEALDGNVSPILEDNVKAKGFTAGIAEAEKIRGALAGSYLWQSSENRAVQDPLSFRDAVWINGTLSEKNQQLQDKLTIQLNHADDNPTIVPFVKSASESPEVKKRYLAEGGALFSASNFDATPWVIDIEATTIALAHAANASAQRIIKLNDPSFTHLSRFLGTDKTYHAFGAMEKPPVALAREIQLLAQPASVATMAVAGTIEDVASNAPLASHNLQKALDNYAYILGMELIHAAQAIDLRLQKNPDLALGTETKALYQAFRKEVEFMSEDKPLSADFERAKNFIINY